MGRYANSLVRLEFPDLSEDGDLIQVTIRNPKTVPADKLIPADLPVGADGTPDRQAAMDASYTVMAGLVTDWHVYDATAADDSPPLPLPATAEALRSLPFEIVQSITDRIGQVLTPPQ
jgi:hypothetical protein